MTTSDPGPDIAQGRRRWASALHPVLFAAYPVLFLWSQNLGETETVDVLIPLVILMLAVALLTVLLGLVTRDVRRAAVIITPLVIGLSMYGHAARVARPLHLPALVQQAGWVALVAVAAVFALRASSPWLQRVGTGLTRIAAILIVITLVTIVPFAATDSATGAEPVAGTGLPTTTAAPLRDVYWFIFDRYGSNRALDIAYDVQSDLEPWLRDQGFTVLDGSHANYVKTSLSLATTMQMTHLADIPGVPDPAATGTAFVTSQIRTSKVARQFKALGYRFINIGSWYGPTRTSPLADLNLHTPAPTEFTASLIEASAIPPLLKRLGLGEVNPRTRHWENNQYGLAAAAGVRDEPGPKFVFSHILLPHPPYTHAADGHFLTPEETRGRSARTLYADQLTYANTRIREIIDGLLTLPEAQRPIIILQADEGPGTLENQAKRFTTWDWTRATPDDVEAKYGILNAWYVPGDRPVGLYDGQTSINTFPLLFRDYFGLDYNLLPDRVFASRRFKTNYDQIEITDLVPAP
jgi:hypothetical protein